MKQLLLLLDAVLLLLISAPRIRNKANATADKTIAAIFQALGVSEKYKSEENIEFNV